MSNETFAASAADVAVEGVEYVSEIARSESALVYRGRQTAEPRDVAVKILGLAKVPAGALEAAGSLPPHPHIVRVHAVGVNASGHPYLVTDYLEGGSMAERIERDGPLAWGQALRAGVKLAVALDAAHQRRLLHTGIKPTNVLLSADGDVRLGDFVITELRRRSTTRQAVSFAYVAPEVLAGTNATRASDIFSLAATIFTMITGHPPTHVGGEAVAELRRRRVPVALARVVGQALAEDPAARPATAKVFARALRDAASAPDPGQASPERRNRFATENDGSGPRVAGGRGSLRAAAAVAVVVAALAAYVVLRQPPAGEPGDQAAPQVLEGGAVAAAAAGDLAPFGIDGIVVAGPDVSLPGLEVRSVADSSAGLSAGVLPGDLITRVAGIHLAGDVTDEYEALVGALDAQAALPIQVLRRGEGVIYAGELNGSALAPVIDRSVLAGIPGGGEAPDAYVEIIDQTGAIKAASPTGWGEVDTEPFVDLGPNIQTAPDLGAFRDGWGSPGLNVTATNRRDVDDLGGIMASFIEPGGLADCATDGTRPYADGAFSGLVQYFTFCGGTPTGFVQVVATPADRSFVLQLGVQLVDQDDLPALSAAIASARVVGAL